eukprot:5667594-Pleurochrysis_carterae.AAC.1
MTSSRRLRAFTTTMSTRSYQISKGSIEDEVGRPVLSRYDMLSNRLFKPKISECPGTTRTRMLRAHAYNADTHITHITRTHIRRKSAHAGISTGTYAHTRTRAHARTRTQSFSHLHTRREGPRPDQRIGSRPERWEGSRPEEGEAPRPDQREGPRPERGKGPRTDHQSEGPRPERGEGPRPDQMEGALRKGKGCVHIRGKAKVPSTSSLKESFLHKHSVRGVQIKIP